MTATPADNSLFDDSILPTSTKLVGTPPGVDTQEGIENRAEQALTKSRRPCAYTHPIYDAMFDTWEMLRQTYEGGEEYTHNHLFKHPKEANKFYARRLQRAVSLNHTQVIVDTYSAHLYKAPIMRSSPASAKAVLEEYRANITLTGVPADEFYEEESRWAQVYGALPTVTDRYEPEGEVPRTRADEQAMGRRPYSYWLHPQDLINWRMDARGEFIWAVVREYRERETKFDESPGEPEEIYRYWTRDGWALYQTEEIEEHDAEGRPVKRYKYEKIGEGTHPLKKVPIEMLYMGKRVGRQPIARSPIADIAPHQRRLMNLLSLIDEQIYQHVFNLLCVGEKTFEKLTKISFSVAGVLPVYADEEKPFYLGPDVSQAAFLRSEVDKTENTIRFHGGLGRQNESSKAAVSGESMAYQTMDKRALLERCGQRMSDIEGRQDRLALRWMEVQIPDDLEPPPYTVELEPGELEQALADALSFEALGIAAVEAAIENAIQAARARFGKLVDPERLEEILEDIRKTFRQAKAAAAKGPAVDEADEHADDDADPDVDEDLDGTDVDEDGIEESAPSAS